MKGLIDGLECCLIHYNNIMYAMDHRNVCVGCMVSQFMSIFPLV